MDTLNSVALDLMLVQYVQTGIISAKLLNTLITGKNVDNIGITKKYNANYGDIIVSEEDKIAYECYEQGEAYFVGRINTKKDEAYLLGVEGRKMYFNRTNTNVYIIKPNTCKRILWYEEKDGNMTINFVKDIVTNNVVTWDVAELFDRVPTKVLTENKHKVFEGNTIESFDKNSVLQSLIDEETEQRQNEKFDVKSAIIKELANMSKEPLFIHKGNIDNVVAKLLVKKVPVKEINAFITTLNKLFDNDADQISTTISTTKRRTKQKDVSQD